MTPALLDKRDAQGDIGGYFIEIQRIVALTERLFTDKRLICFHSRSVSV